MIASLLVSLALTLLIELSVLVLLGLRHKRDLWVAVCANVLTNPVVVLVANLLFIYYPSRAWLGVALLEVGAVATEGFIYRHCLTFKKINPWVLSLLANIISFETGIVISYFHLLASLAN